MNELRKLQVILQTIADFNRLGILRFICDKECAVGEIVNATKLSQPLVSHHLKVLKGNGILETRRNGPFIYYYLRDVKILYAINLLAEIFKESDVAINTDFKFCPDRILDHFKNIS